jgi:hypothetical protein
VDGLNDHFLQNGRPSFSVLHFPEDGNDLHIAVFSSDIAVARAKCDNFDVEGVAFIGELTVFQWFRFFGPSLVDLLLPSST